MADFNDQFWNLFIVVVTLASILGLYLLILWMSQGRPPEKVETTGHIWDEDLADLNNPMPRWWLNMFLITLVWGVVYLIFFPGLGSNQGVLDWSELNQYEKEVAAADERYGPLFAQYAELSVARLAKEPEALEVGRRLYATYCTGCHGSDAGGGPGYPNLRDANWQWGGTPEAIETTILKGRNAAMPPWKDALGEEGVRQVTQYVMSLSGREVDQEMAAAGKQKYDENCVACHQANGSGNEALGAPSLRDDVWLYGGSQAAIEKTLSLGRNGQMPAFEEFLGKDKVHLLAAYIYSLSR